MIKQRTKSELRLKAEAYLKAKSDARQIEGGSFGGNYYWMQFELDGNSSEDHVLANELVALLTADYDADYDYDTVRVCVSEKTGNYYIYATWRDRDYVRV